MYKKIIQMKINNSYKNQFWRNENVLKSIEVFNALPNLSAAAIPRTTAIGCFKQNSCSCGLNACFLFSK